MASPLQELQKDPVELERVIQKPHEFYNKYMRKEGEKVLSEEDFKNSVHKVNTDFMITQMKKGNATTKS